MNFKEHSNLIGQHAFLSASKYHWINYDEDKISESYLKFLATVKGTQLHSFACDCIKLGIKLPKSKKTLNMYVNDAIGFKMTPEQPLFYSNNAFGTADSISFRNKKLRIHDLKTGESSASISQLEIYAALFCLEYDIDPFEITIELRIYQYNTIFVHEPDPDEITMIMQKIISFDEQIERIKSGEE